MFVVLTGHLTIRRKIGFAWSPNPSFWSWRIVKARDWTWVSSTVVDYEIDQTPDAERSQRVKLIWPVSPMKEITPGKPERERAQELELLGFQSFDALHLACAESGTD